MSTTWARCRLVSFQVTALAVHYPLARHLPSQRSLEHRQTTHHGEIVGVTKASKRDIIVTGTFAVRRALLFEALTKPDGLRQWMSAGAMELASVQADPRAGGSFRYVYKRPTGRTIEVLGKYRTFDSPRSFSYLETYNFSPLRIEVTTALEESAGKTRLTRTLHYSSLRERDEDFEGVAASSREAFAKLARLVERGPATNTATQPRNRRR